MPMPKNVQLASMKPRKYKKVLTVGVYDLLHKGHVELYRRAKGLGDYLIVAAQDGDFILKYKPTAKVLNSTEDRKYMIKSIRYVDEVITYTDVDKIVKEVDFDVFVTGPDQCHDGFKRAIQWCEANGKEHIILGRTDGVSSSELKAKIAEKTAK
jgi:glycerol-3-phosphate cytidylyltransferase